MKVQPKVLARSGAYYAKEGATKSGDRIIYVCKDHESREEPTMKDESWDKIATIVIVISIAVIIWALIPGCSPSLMSFKPNITTPPVGAVAGIEPEDYPSWVWAGIIALNVATTQLTRTWSHWRQERKAKKG